MTGSHWVVFTISPKGKCALPAADVRRLIHIPHLTRPPGIPSLVEGFLNLAGSVIPVLRIDRLFGEPDIAFDPYLCVIVLKNASPPLSLLVEGVDTVIRLHADHISPVDPGESFNACVTASATVDGQDIALLDTRRLLTVREERTLAELLTIQQQRLAEIGGAA
ncbi:chemotaxis protein CheW [Ferrovibrio xuzhouensis]|uniref:Chemotaxis protein CheW n=1 Tax=Ferrovibrio xuzhouensis TaxID=1576914 RepID=A0ABV7VE93_9PROT